MHSPKFDTYKAQYELNWMTKAQLRQWVAMQTLCPLLGITAEEYQEITGDAYDE